MKFIGEKLTSLRKARKLSMMEVAEKTGLHQSNISDLETGKTKNPRPETVEKLCQGLKINEEYFYLENSRLPTDVLPPLPAKTEKFIMDGENIPYLIVSEKAKEAGLSPETLEKLIDLYAKK
jgi:transcriptional regulator with XRE-family HTH domain